MHISIADLRKEYTLHGLKETEIHSNPYQQFQTWFTQAIAAQLPEPNAMILATATSDGKPSSRIVLLKEFNEEGFVFFTNYQSQKGQELATNPWASLVFWWAELERQVRIEGRVEKVSDTESDDYFHSRPIGSQLGAWVSEQSQIIANREVLENRLFEIKRQYQNQVIPRPPHWGGFRLIPTEIEFWQGRPNRLHDRLKYTPSAHDIWIVERLAP